MAKAPFILLVNPWVTDFAAYDLWSKPMGLLGLAALLRDGGCGVAFIDCMDRFDPASAGRQGLHSGVMGRFGTGKYPKAPIDKPEVYAGVPRTYYRYGIHPESFRRRLETLPTPELIWLTGIMSYWYPGVRRTIEVIRTVFPETPTWLGGIYSRLCSRHARDNSGADRVFTEAVSILPDRLEAATGYRVTNREAWSGLASAPAPALDLLDHLDYVPILTSLGCPFHCPYCASAKLQPRIQTRRAERLIDEIRHWHLDCGVVDFAFYDDALLLSGGDAVRTLLEQVLKDGLKVRFHTPNALHIRALTKQWCDLLWETGFTTLRLGLETTRPERQKEWGGKVEAGMFLKAVSNLRSAGFPATQVGVYLLSGLPGQAPAEVAEAIEFVHRQGAQPYLAEYSPIPGTVMWPEAVALSAYDIASEPLYHNNTFFACRRPDFTYRDLETLKTMARDARRRLQRLEAGETPVS